jgi:large subunit ribosomal protein L25
MKRMRQAGNVPAVLYGGNGKEVLLSVSALELGKVIKAGSKAVQLAGSVSGAAEIRELQWDTFGKEVLHIDFVRV